MPLRCPLALALAPTVEAEVSVSVAMVMVGRLLERMWCSTALATVHMVQQYWGG
jgi:hypothetical protein